MARARKESGRYGEEVVALRGIPHIAEELEKLERRREGLADIGPAPISGASRGAVSMTLSLRTLDTLARLVAVLGENRGRVVDRCVMEFAARYLKKKKEEEGEGDV